MATFTGTAGADTLTGGAQADVLDGLGGSDVMRGGAGDDVYRIDRASDIVTEVAGGGTDRVDFVPGRDISSLTYTLPGNVEHFQPLDVSTRFVLNITGNASNNRIVGDAGSTRLNGGGGNDTLAGRGGNDTYDGGAGNDTLNDTDGNDTYIFARGRGVDTVQDSGNGNDTVRVDGNFATGGVTMAYEGSVLVISITGTSDRMRIINPNSIETVIINGSAQTPPPAPNAQRRNAAGPELAGGGDLVRGQAQALVQAMASFGQNAGSADVAQVQPAVGVHAPLAVGITPA